MVSNIFWLINSIRNCCLSTKKSKNDPIKAYIITNNCSSNRFLSTKTNIERVFPKFFRITCYLHVHWNDPRLHPVNLVEIRKPSSNLLTFLDLWSYVIPNEPNLLADDWVFIFEDDVNFIDPKNVSLVNFITPLKLLIENVKIQNEHGFIYLGMCKRSLINSTVPFLLGNMSNTLQIGQGCGTCLHATGITAKRAHSLWTEITEYRPNTDEFIDQQMQEYCFRSGKEFLILGTNLASPFNQSHRGIAYQDRFKFKLH